MDADVTVVEQVIRSCGHGARTAVGRRLILLKELALLIWTQSADNPPGTPEPGPAQKEGQSLPAALRPLGSSASKIVPDGSLMAVSL